jgi:hypothetical protein
MDREIEKEFNFPDMKQFEYSKYLSPLTKFYAWVLREAYIKNSAEEILFSKLADNDILERYGSLGWNVSNVIINDDTAKRLEKSELRWFAKKNRTSQKLLKSQRDWKFHWMNYSPSSPTEEEAKKIKKDKIYLTKFIRRKDGQKIQLK